jgi:hypothetical protein
MDKTAKQIEIPKELHKLRYRHFRPLLKQYGIKVLEFERNAGKYSGWVRSHAHKEFVPVVMVREMVNQIGVDVKIIIGRLEDIIEMERVIEERRKSRS